MQALSSEALPLPANPKVVTKWGFIYVKRAKAKTVSYRTLGFPEYGMANASNFTPGFTPASNPKGVTTYGQRNGLLFMLKGPKLKTVSYRT